MRDDPLALATNAAVARGTEGQMIAALRDITAVLDAAAPSETRLSLALALAQQHDAYLTGLSVLDLLMPARPVVHPRRFPEADPQAAEKAARLETAFRERLRLSGVQGDWRAGGKVSEIVVRQTRYADLIILG